MSYIRIRDYEQFVRATYIEILIVSLRLKCQVIHWIAKSLLNGFLFIESRIQIQFGMHSVSYL